MKDIDFLPEWYKSGIRREVSYRTQYIALGGVFVVLAVWSFTTSHSISKAKAEFADMAARHSQAESVSKDLAALEDQLGNLRKRLESMEEVDSKIDVASVLAEISFLMNEEIVLDKVEFIAEKFPGQQKDNASPVAGAVVRAVRVKNRQQEQLPLGNVRFKVVISGVAANPSDVAALTCKLEESPYFFQVVPAFSRSKELPIGTAPSSESTTDAGRRTSTERSRNAEARKSLQVSEFEINCYLANYRKL